MATNNATNTSNPITVAQGGTGDSSLTAYAVLCGGTSSTASVQALAALGASGTVLTSNGASALPSFQAAAGGGNLVLLSSQTATTVASISFTSQITGTYNTYILYISNVVATSGGPILSITFSTNGGSSYLGSGYLGGQAYVQTSSSATWNVSNATSNIVIGGTSTTSSLNTMIVLTNMTNGSSPEIYGMGGGNGYFYSITGQQTTGSINAMKLSVASSTMATGTFTLFGLLE